MSSPPSVLLDVRDVSLVLPIEGGEGRVLDGVNLTICRGELHGIVGESGCGKSSLVKLIFGLSPPGARITSGRIRFADLDLLRQSDKNMNDRLRGKQIGFIPQDPFQSFNPLFAVGVQIMEAVKRSPAAAKGRARARARLLEVLELVQIQDPVAALRKYPHQFSGGQLQRLMIACAFACEPRLVLADEPTSALDVTTQQQVLALIEDLVRAAGVAVLLVTHDLGLVVQHCDRVTVMYAGQTVETMPAERLLDVAKHPYAADLLACHPDRGGGLRGIPGMVPPLSGMPPGCRFHPRCAKAFDPCRIGPVPGVEVSPGHVVHCRLYEAGERREAFLGAS